MGNKGLIQWKRIFSLTVPWICVVGLCYGQQNPWLPIIESDISVEARQVALDSFLQHRDTKFPMDSLAEFYHDIGNRLYYRSWTNSGEQKYMDSALNYTYRAVQLKRDLYLGDRASLKKSLYNLGYFYQSNEDYFKAIEAYLSLVDLGDEDPKTHAAFQELGLSFMAIGDFHKAINSYEKIIEFYDNDESGRYQLQRVHRRLADLYSYMGHKNYAAQIDYHLKKATSLYLNSDSNMFHLAQINLLRGNLLLMLENYKEAIIFHEKALDNAEGFSDHNLAVIHNSLGVSYDKLGFEAIAKDLFLKAMRLSINYSAPYENMGDLYLDQKDFKTALMNYQIAVAMTSNIDLVENYEDVPSRDDMELSPEKTALLDHMVTKANGWLEYYKHDNNQDHLIQALNTFELADQLIDLIRSESTEYQTQLYWREQSANLYMKAVEVCYLLGDYEKAYYFMERNKALLLLENITHEQAKELSQLPDSIAQREFELKREIFLAENALSNAIPIQETAGIKDSIFKFKRNYDLFQESIETAYPDYARLKSQLEILPYDKFMSVYVNDSQAVLQYILNEEQGYGLFHSKEGSEFFNLGDAEKLNQQLTKVHRQLAGFQLDQGKTNELIVLSNDLYQRLLPENFSSLVADKKLLVIPDYLLQRLPFEALVTEPEPLKYLIELAEVNYAYSFSYLYSKEEIETKPDKYLVAVAPVEFESLGLAQLRFSLAEAEGINKIFGGELLEGDSATKSAFLNLMSTYKILHLCTHADIDENGNHWVAFKDEKLYLNEIYANRNQADMVVLSACNTSRGDLKKGEGVMSLARAFFNSGAKCVVSSLWPVQDKAGKEIMIEFYNGLDKGLTKSSALRQAKLAYLDKNQQLTSSPSFWASLIVIGDNSPLEASRSMEDIWPAILIVIVILLFLFSKYSIKTVKKNQS